MAATLASSVTAAVSDVYRSLTHSDAPLKATFQRLEAPSIPRSSHTINVVGKRAYIFGGEIAPREPVDNSMHVLNLALPQSSSCGYEAIAAKAASGSSEIPQARVGHSSATIGKHIYVFGGRGGPSMSALEEHGRVWVFDTVEAEWSYLDPIPDSPSPETRSYHTMAATPFPAPKSAPNISDVLLNQTPDPTKDVHHSPPPETIGTIFIHAGCLSSGGRTSDLWSFDIASRTWAQLPSAPDPPRGGTSLTIIRDRLYRFGGFDGNTEQGGQIDYLNVNLQDEYNDQGGQGFMAVSPRGEWQKVVIPAEADPGKRSVLGFVPVTNAIGKEHLIMICGEGQASNAGHAAAGKFFDDVWSFDPAGIVDTESKESAKMECKEVEYHLHGEGALREGQAKPMGRRGWIAADVCRDIGTGNSVIVWGGVGEDNKRLGDGWVITLQ